MGTHYLSWNYNEFGVVATLTLTEVNIFRKLFYIFIIIIYDLFLAGNRKYYCVAKVFTQRNGCVTSRKFSAKSLICLFTYSFYCS